MARDNLALGRVLTIVMVRHQILIWIGHAMRVVALAESLGILVVGLICGILLGSCVSERWLGLTTLGTGWQ
jgi:hypothetical protein